MDELSWEFLLTDRIVRKEVFLELFFSAIHFTVLYNIYKGIEISHPVYAIVFCNNFINLVSSLINVAILPFVINYKYTVLVNGNNAVCLVFNSCCWCILSLLRYLYVTKKTWLQNKFPEPVRLLKVSFSALGILAILSVSSGLATGMYFGYPKVKVVDMTREQKIACAVSFLIYQESML
jgi:hypothetical protein